MTLVRLCLQEKKIIEDLGNQTITAGHLEFNKKILRRIPGLYSWPTKRYVYDEYHPKGVSSVFVQIVDGPWP